MTVQTKKAVSLRKKSMTISECIKSRFALPEICGAVAPDAAQLDATMISQIDWRRLASTADGLATATGVNELNTVFQLAATTMYTVFRNEVRNRGLTQSTIVDKVIDSGFRKSTLVAAGTTGQLRGVRVCIAGANYVAGLRRVAVTKVVIWSGANYVALPVTFAYSDGTTDVITVAVTAGQNTIALPNGRVLLGAEYIDILLPSDTLVYSVEKYPKCGCPGVPSIPCAAIRTNDNGTIGALDAKSECFGIIVSYSCVCDFEGLFCNIVSQGAMDSLIIQQVNLTALKRAIESRTVSIYAPIGDNAAALYGMYEKDLKEANAAFYMTLKSIAGTLNDGFCVVCSQSITIKSK